MFRPRHWLALAAAVALGLASCRSTQTTETCYEDGSPEGCAPKARVAVHPTMHALAADLDHLEKHIDWFGSVVAKQPDVWGQARLTRYRQQFEEEIFKNYPKFGYSLQGSLARSDQAYFANALALSMAIQPPRNTTTTKTVLVPTEQTVKVTDTSVTKRSDALKDTRVASLAADSAKSRDDTDTSETTTKYAPPPAPTKITPTDLGDPSSLVGAVEFKRNELVKAAGFAGFTEGIGIEPTELIAQKARYLNYLDQIRRTNEGDDTSDSPGYALHLIRVPVSVLPGKHTDTGYGAEVTMSLTPVLGDELLPVTFRGLVVNDIAKHVTLPIAVALNDAELRRVISVSYANYMAGGLAPSIGTGFRQMAARVTQAPIVPEQLQHPTPLASPILAPQVAAMSTKQNARMQAANNLQQIRQRITIPVATNRKGRLPFPPSEIHDIYGSAYLGEIVLRTYGNFRKDIEDRGYVGVPELQAFMQEETIAAYRLLATPENLDLWRFCNQNLAHAIRTHRYDHVQCQRSEFEAELNRRAVKPFEPNAPSTPVGESLRAALAWAIIVESALLTDRLVLDMREAASAKGSAAPADVWLDYYLPQPSPEARRAFNEYVHLRWPIHVFALDPNNEEQNIADSFSRRRETQLALSLAFVSGNISARNFTRYARRLEAEFQTVALNRTQVGFSHGSDTFGWRFYPRFQTPEVEPNLTVLVRDQLIGGPSKDAELRKRKLEPGARECVALVIMPSFVPYVTLDATANWFKLDNPKHKSLDHTQAMHLSRTVKSLQTASAAVRDADCYRDGDLGRLLRRVDQLSARLPLQTETIQVPYEATMGGFEMFNSGITDLAPELYGWYGAPGVNPAGDTTLFLIGDNFSVNATKVLIGNQPVANQVMLSRQVMQVTLAKGALARADKEVEVHVATPYGVTATLAIPVYNGGAAADPAAAEGYSLSTNSLTATYCLNGSGDRFTLGPVTLRPGDQSLELLWHDALGAAPSQVQLDLTFRFRGHALCSGPLTLAVSPGTGGKYSVPAKELVEEFGRRVAAAAGTFKLSENPLAEPFTATVSVLPMETAERSSKRIAVKPGLTIQFVASSFCDCSTTPPPPAANVPPSGDTAKPGESPRSAAPQWQPARPADARPPDAVVAGRVG